MSIENPFDQSGENTDSPKWLAEMTAGRSLEEQLAIEQQWAIMSPDQQQEAYQHFLSNN